LKVALRVCDPQGAQQLTGVKGFMGSSSPVPTRTALRRQMLPTPNLTLDGKRQLSAFQNLKTQCSFKLAELVENHRMAIKPGGDRNHRRVLSNQTT
jgi:hypothetical protein